MIQRLFAATPDVDGTLVFVGHVNGLSLDTHAYIGACQFLFRQLARGAAMPHSFAAYLASIDDRASAGKSHDDGFRMLLQQMDAAGLRVPVTRQRELLRSFTCHYDDIVCEQIARVSRPRDAVLNVVRALHEHIPLMPVSNSGARVVSANLALCQIDEDHTVGVITADDINPHKPNPDMYETAFYDMLETYGGAQFDLTLLCFEDSITGLTAALEAETHLRANGYKQPIDVFALPHDRATWAGMKNLMRQYSGVSAILFDPEHDHSSQHVQQALLSRVQQATGLPLAVG